MGQRAGARQPVRGALGVSGCPVVLNPFPKDLRTVLGWGGGGPCQMILLPSCLDSRSFLLENELMEQASLKSSQPATGQAVDYW